jgi:glycosyltransferase involved in cell wall biosynthesis
MENIKITLLEPFFSGSHKQWAEGLQKHSKHNVQILSLPGRHWKWRMHGGAVSLAKQFNQLEESPDLILATSMLDLTTFLSLTRKRSANIPVAMYFHENQLTYPWSPQDRDVKKKRNNHYSFINYASALAADKVFFNSKYHMDSFLGALPKFLKQFPDKRERDNIDVIREKSEVLHLGLDLKRFEDFRSSDKEKQSEATILWNHRWEYDKNPEEFFETLFELKKKEIKFKLVVLGEQNDVNPPIFDEAKEKLKDEILHWGYADSFDDYAKWLWRADILSVTSNQDFFGGSVIEAMYCDCFPLLPNRLAYPEHLPEELEREFLYEEGELPTRLETAIESVMGIRQVDYQSIVKKYDWNELIEKYDTKLEELK